MKFKAEITDKGIKMETACTVTEMLSCISMITNELYTRLPDGVAKDFFEFSLKKAVNDGIMFTDEEGRRKIVKKYAKELVEEVGQSKEEEKKLDEIMKELKGLLDDD